MSTDNSTELAPVLVNEDDTDARRAELTSVVERVAIVGDLSKLNPADRIRYYARLCESLGLNPLTRPFEYVHYNGKLVLYARRDATDQLRYQRKVSIDTVTREPLPGDLYAVTVGGSLPDGRRDESVGIVSIKGLSGLDLANAYMKAETKGKRRLTLSLAGLGFLDETEVADIPDATLVDVDDDGQIQTELPAEPQGTDRLKAALGLNDPSSESAVTPEPAPESAAESPPAAPAAVGPPDERSGAAGQQDVSATTAPAERAAAQTPVVRCAHPPSAHESTPEGVRCQLCSTLLSVRDPIGEALEPQPKRKRPDPPEGTFPLEQGEQS